MCVCVCVCVSVPVWLWLSSSNKPSGRWRWFLVPPTCTHTSIYTCYDSVWLPGKKLPDTKWMEAWLIHVMLAQRMCSLEIRTFLWLYLTCLVMHPVYLCLFCYDRGRWWVLCLMTVFTCGTWGRRDQPSSTRSSSTERGKRCTRLQSSRETVCQIDVTILLLLLLFHCFSSLLSVRTSHSLWCDMNCVLPSRGSVTVCCLCELLVFADCQYENRRNFIWQMCWHACRTLRGAKEVTETDALSLSLSLSFSLCLSVSLSVSVLLSWLVTEHSLFGSLTLPLRLSHHWGSGVNPPKHLKVYTSRCLHTPTHKQNENTQATNTHTAAHVDKCNLFQIVDGVWN